MLLTSLYLIYLKTDGDGLGILNASATVYVSAVGRRLRHAKPTGVEFRKFKTKFVTPINLLYSGTATHLNFITFYFFF